MESFCSGRNNIMFKWNFPLKPKDRVNFLGTSSTCKKDGGNLMLSCLNLLIYIKHINCGDIGGICFVLFCFLSGVLVRAKSCCKCGLVSLYTKFKRQFDLYGNNSESFKIVFCSLRLVFNSCLKTKQGRKICILRVFLGQECMTIS